MFFASPLWLVGLVPWAGLATWLLLGRRQRVPVPFVALWKGPTDGPRARPSLTRPPLFVLLGILSLFIAVLASARPMKSTGKPHVTLILDRGMTMLLRDEPSDRHLFTAIEQRFGVSAVNVRTVPATPRAPADLHIVAVHESLVSTADLLPTIVREALNDPSNLVIVNTDQSLKIVNARFAVIPPPPIKPHPAIVDIAARAEPMPQVMVRVRDVTSSVAIRVESGVESESKIIPPANGEQTVFVDMPALGREVHARLEQSFPRFDSGASLVRETSAARVVGSPGLPESLKRMIDVYSRHRPAEGAQDVFIATAARVLPADKPGVVLSEAPAGSGTAGVPALVQSHPVTNEVKFGNSTGGKSPPGWKSIVTCGDTTLVAIKDGPPRQVWVCMNGAELAATTSYVIFWTNVFDWLGGESGEYRWHAMSEWSSVIDGDHVPGIYQQADGTERAFNAIGIPLPVVEQPDWRKRLDALKNGAGSVDLTPSACIAAIVLMTLAVLLLEITWSIRARSIRSPDR